MKIYEISTAMRNALDSIEVDEETGEILNAELLDAVTEEATAKVANCARFIREEEAEIEAMKQAMANIKSRMDSKKKRLEWLKTMTVKAVLEVGKVEEADIRVSTRKSEAVEVDESILGKEWMTETVTYKPNKTALKHALKNGEPVEGAVLVTNFSLSIK